VTSDQLHRTICCASVASLDLVTCARAERDTCSWFGPHHLFAVESPCHWMSRRAVAQAAVPKILLSSLSPNPHPFNHHCLRRSALMASSAASADLESFSTHLQSSQRILALLGAGLSASSGLPTFRGAGGLWRSHDAMSLATPEAFDADPGLVWQFYSYRRHMALAAKPNRAHYALAELARRKEGFATLSQNVDGECWGSPPSVCVYLFTDSRLNT